MSESARQGGCRCGKVRFEATGAPLLTSACHCRGCQHLTSSAFSLTSTFSKSAFRVSRGEPVIGALHGTTHHYFCDYCKSWLYTEGEAMNQIVNVRSTLFDAPDEEPPFMEMQRDEGLPWARTEATHCYGKMPEMNEWPELMKKFAARHDPAKEAN